jgi:quercetin dioxygenase-like cupin family protein
MRVRNILAFAVSILVAGTVLAQAAGEAKMKSAPKTAVNAPKFMPSADMKWVELDPKGAPGVMIADLWGDHTKGAYGSITKFPAGFTAPLHTHTNGMKIVIISGTFIAGPEGKPEVRLGPGSYFWQPGGNYRHTTACDKASECVFFSESTGKFDLKVVGEAKAPAKKM